MMEESYTKVLSFETTLAYAEQWLRQADTDAAAANEKAAHAKSYRDWALTRAQTARAEWAKAQWYEQDTSSQPAVPTRCVARGPGDLDRHCRGDEGHEGDHWIIYEDRMEWS